MTETPEVATKSSKKKVLIIDDTPENLTVLGNVLNPFYHVTVANSGARGLAAAASFPHPELILLDVMMPEMDGYEVLQRLRDSPETRDIPVIFVTARDATADETLGLELGAADYIAKPIRPAIVLARVKGQLDLKEARDRIQNQNHWLEAEVQRRMHQNHVIQDVAMRALASVAEARDNETGNHILRTQHYVKVLATHLAKLPEYADRLPPETIETFVKAAPLHDVGKVGIPDVVLHKPGKHSPEEWAIMQTHAQIGAEAIWRAIKGEEDRKALGFLYVAMEIAGSHHEKWDGSGYPKGAAGEAIPLSGRLMALADVFDALISKRCYKPAFSIEHAIAIIVEGRGRHFDPDVVDAFLANIDAFREIAGRFVDAA